MRSGPYNPSAPEWNVLPRSVEPIARVAETGNDEAVLVQAAVDGCDDDRGLRVVAVDALDALGRRDERDQPTLCAPARFTSSTAAAVELPVASIGSSRITSRSAMSWGSFT